MNLALATTGRVVHQFGMAVRKWRSWLSFITLFLIGFLVVGTMPAPDTLLTVSSETEIVSFELVETSNAAAFPLILSNAQVVSSKKVFLDSNPEKDGCSGDSLRVFPQAGAELYYMTDAQGDFTIGIIGSANIEHKNGNFTLGEGDYMRYTISSESLCLPKSIRLPLRGKVRFGSVANEPIDDLEAPALLLDGKITIYSRSTSSLFGIPLNFGPFEANAFYMAARFDVPSYSVIENARRTRDTNASEAIWRGFADIEMTGQGFQMRANASVNADEVQVRTMSLSLGDDETPKVDRVAASFTARVFGDPNLNIVYGLLLFFLLFVQTFPSVIPKRRPEC